MNSTRQELQQGLAPAVKQLDQQKRQRGMQQAFGASMRWLPWLALALVLGYCAISWLAAPPMAAIWLPALLLVVPLLLVLVAALHQVRTRSKEAALAIDRQQHTKDRLSAAVEFSEEGEVSSLSRFQRAALMDGQACLLKVQADQVRLAQPAARMPWLAGLLALALVFVPFFLPAISGVESGVGKDLASLAVDVSGQALSSEQPDEAKEDASESERQRRKLSRAALAERAAEEEKPETKKQPEQNDEAQKSGAGSSNPTPGGQRPAQSQPQKSNAGQPSPGSQGGGGQGQASKSQGDNEDKPKERKPRKASNPKKKKKGHPVRSKEQDAQESSSTPGGPSQAGGQMASVGNKRSSDAQGLEREQDVDQDDEEIEDEEEESEQRGGVSPMSRDRKSNAARELGATADGAGGEGRGGPMPPKKSRGVAALVMGIRLPDKVRGQPNPGTAKTSVEQVTPRMGQEREASAQAAVAGGAATPQTSEPLTDPWQVFLFRYHWMLSQARQAKKTNTQP